MPDRAVYRAFVAADSQMTNDGNLQSQIQQLQNLSEGPASATRVATDPEQYTLNAFYRGYGGPRQAREIRSLFNADADSFGAVPVYGVDSNGYYKTPEDGYYALDSADLQRADGRTEQLIEVRGQLTKIGTRKTHWRSLATGPVQPEGGHSFGNETHGEVGVPAAASKLRWLNEGSGETEKPTIQRTENAEYGDVDIIDAQQSSFAEPTAIYELPFHQHGRTDVSIWDTRGFSSKIQTYNNIDVQEWERLFTPAAEPEEKFVLENGLIRLFVDETAQSMSVDRWEEGNSTWDSVSLTDNDWQPWDIDIRTITPSRSSGYFTFENSSNDNLFTLRFVLHRGWTDFQWFRRANETDPIPSGLEDYVDNIAAATVVDSEEAAGVTERSKVN